jgi:hypothetical protein
MTTEANDATRATSSLDYENIPSVTDLQRHMNDLSEQLYLEWKRELAERLWNLEFQGFIAQTDVNVSSTTWRLPNEQVRFALCKLETDLQDLEYDYKFEFQDVDDVNWVLFYHLQLPERMEDISDEYSK